MPAIAQRTTTPSLQNDTLAIPASFPTAPVDAIKANPALTTWNNDINSWWAKTRKALGELNTDIGGAVQQVQSASQNLKANANGYTALVNTERIARIDADGALAQLITTVEADYHSADATVSASVTTEQTARVTADSALASSITALNASFTTALSTTNASIVSEATARANADSAIATTLTSLTSTVTTNNTTLTAAISTEQTARANADTAITTSVSTLSATVTTNNTTLQALITTEQSARVAQDLIFAGQISTLSATTGNHTFLQASTSTPTATATGDLWFQTDLGNKPYYWNGSAWTDATDTRLTTTAAAVSTEQSARITQDGILASNNTTTLAVANGAVTAVNTEQSARISADGNLSGKYTLTVSAGNVVTGMNITSSTGSGTNISSVIFNAANFQIYNSSTSTGVAPFQVSGGVVTVTGSLVIHPGDIQGTAVVSGGAASDINSNTTTISGGKITTGTVTLAQLNFTPASTSNIVATINASTEGITISGARVAINGSTTFSSGYDPSGKIAAGGAAADVNGGSTTINGSMITTGTVTANKISATNLSSIVSDLGTITGGSITIGSGTQQVTVTAGNLSLGRITITSTGTASDTVLQAVGGDLSKISLNARFTSLAQAELVGTTSFGTEGFYIGGSGGGFFTGMGLIKGGVHRPMYFFTAVISPNANGVSTTFDYNISTPGFPAAPQVVLIAGMQGLMIHAECQYSDVNNTSANLRFAARYLDGVSTFNTGSLYRFAIFAAEI